MIGMKKLFMNGCQNGHPEFSSGSILTFETYPDPEVSGRDDSF